MSPAQKIQIVGLIGGVGSGKSRVASILMEAGCVVADSDQLVRRVYEAPEVRAELQTWWGPGVVNDAGQIDRAAVAAVVFRDPVERKRLEALIHPKVEAARRAIFAAAPPGTRALVIDAPLLLEAGLGGECSQIWFVDAPETARRARVMSDRGWSAEELDRREAAQWSLDRKRAAAHHVIRNDGDPASLREQVLQALGNLPKSP